MAYCEMDSEEAKNHKPKVVFVDDDTKNIRAARGLNIDNLKVIKAWGE